MKMNKGLFYTLLMLGMAIASVTACNAQSLSSSRIKRDSAGNFVQVKATDSTYQSQCVKTPKTFTALDGTVYPVYLSPKGSLFVIRKSAKTGKEYKQYLKNIE